MKKYRIRSERRGHQPHILSSCVLLPKTGMKEPQRQDNAAYRSHGTFRVAQSNANIPSLSSAAIVSTVCILAEVYRLVREVDLCSGITLGCIDAGTSCWTDDFSGCVTKRMK